MSKMVSIISTDELKKLIDDNDDFVLIDVREPKELENGMIPRAVNIPLAQITKGLNGFDKDKDIIFYCRTGSRSAMAAQTALGLGFDKVRNYEGSVQEWSKFDSNVKMYWN